MELIHLVVLVAQPSLHGSTWDNMISSLACKEIHYELSGPTIPTSTNEMSLWSAGCAHTQMCIVCTLC